jgi:hypothetical protein
MRFDMSECPGGDFAGFGDDFIFDFGDGEIGCGNYVNTYFRGRERAVDCFRVALVIGRLSTLGACASLSRFRTLLLCDGLYLGVFSEGRVTFPRR